MRNVARSGQVTDYDSPWKEALDRYFERFLAFFFPLAHADVDWLRGYETLDGELQKIVPEAQQGRRVVDKLFKVWLRSGEEKWLLIHVEVQSTRDGDFPKRMYVYNYRIFDRYDKEVVSLAILADDDPDWRPSQYGYGRWGFHTGTQFPSIKLLDYVPHEAALEADPNPFATVVLAHLKTLETRRDLGARRAWKVHLVKRLFSRGLSTEDVRQLFRFIDWIMDLPEALAALFCQEITEYQKEKHMPFIDVFERRGMEKGREEGMEKGFLKGIEVSLELKFGPEGRTLLPEIRALQKPEVLQKILEAILTATSPEDLRRVWTR
jgi:hypothetical protein